mmetsp:Transcript_65720/g.213897  ORF Transcript_65720/g.213897 Transcript_65720/m.213897 type:complete len:291 (+) Transcript_65720:228-1100(+)
MRTSRQACCCTGGRPTCLRHDVEHFSAVTCPEVKQSSLRWHASLLRRRAGFVPPVADIRPFRRCGKGDQVQKTAFLPRHWLRALTRFRGQLVQPSMAKPCSEVVEAPHSRAVFNTKEFPRLRVLVSRPSCNGLSGNLSAVTCCDLPPQSRPRSFVQDMGRASLRACDCSVRAELPSTRCLPTRVLACNVAFEPGGFRTLNVAFVKGCRKSFQKTEPSAGAGLASTSGAVCRTRLCRQSSAPHCGVFVRRLCRGRQARSSVTRKMSLSASVVAPPCVSRSVSSAPRRDTRG